MLKEYSVKNFKSILNEILFTMEACPSKVISEYPKHIMEIGDERILKCASIYGPNGAGKSNLLESIFTFIGIALAQGSKISSPDESSYFSNVFSKTNETEYKIFFINDEYEIGYHLIADISGAHFEDGLNDYDPNMKVANQKILYEQCSYRKVKEEEFNLIFERDENGIIYSDALNFLDLVENKIAINNSLTFLRYFDYMFNNKTSMDNSTFKIISDLIFELKSFNVIRAADNRGVLFTKQYVDLYTPLLPKLTRCLKAADINVERMEFRRSENNSYSLYFIKDDEHSISVPLQVESSGTRKLVQILLSIFAYKGSQIFLCDDLDALLHPKLIASLIEMFNSEENTNKQFIFNSQDLVNMNNKLFRRDEIWLCSFENNSSKYIPLSNIVNYKGEMVRKDAIYGKQYLEGRYGRDPIIKKMLDWDNINSN